MIEITFSSKMTTDSIVITFIFLFSKHNLDHTSCMKIFSFFFHCVKFEIRTENITNISNTKNVRLSPVLINLKNRCGIEIWHTINKYLLSIHYKCTRQILFVTITTRYVKSKFTFSSFITWCFCLSNSISISLFVKNKILPEKPIW